MLRDLLLEQIVDVISHFSHRPAQIYGQFGSFLFGHDQVYLGYYICIHDNGLKLNFLIFGAKLYIHGFKHMKFNLLSALFLFACCLSLFACTQAAGGGIHLNGTWQLVSGMTITGKDTVPYAGDFRMIKVINDTHFAFLRHDKNPPKDSANHFDGGGGQYTLTGNQYTEHLDYYADRNWEGKPFTFTVELR